MNLVDAVKAAIPSASSGLCDHVIWERTAFPMGGVSAREVYKAASRVKRAKERGLNLCETCDGVALGGGWCCARCRMSVEGSRASNRKEAAS